MVIKFLLAASILAVPANVYMQSADRDNIAVESEVVAPDASDPKAEIDGAATPADPGISADVRTEPDPTNAKNKTGAVHGEKDAVAIGEGYIRPDAKQRFRNYLNNLGSPLSLAYYAGTAELLTWRNSPKEWGDHRDGYARRFANVAAKNAIMSTTTYALDEAMGLDSTFYRSRDRSLAARLRNCVFSAVTARNRKGKRVLGVPMLAGGVLSEVVSSSGWYPKRYDYEHGLKGGAIAVGVSTGLNLLKEFVWKP